MSVSQVLRWYGQRLRVMGPAEIAHRAGEQAGLNWLRLRHALGAAPRPRGPRQRAGAAFFARPGQALPALPWDESALLVDASGTLAGQWPALGAQWRWQPGPDAWHRAPDTGRDWPQRFFGALPHRAGNPYGDIRVAWEPARLQQLVSLALLSQRLPAAGAGDAVRLLEEQLLSFVAANPALTGIHYVSSMECGLRLMAACHAVDIAGERLARPDAVAEALLAMVAGHAAFIERRLSLHSSAGNHTVAEAAGLVYAGVLFPEFASASRWRATGMRLLVREATRQILDDGGGAEQAPWYLLLITDLYGLVARLLEHRGERVPAPIGDRLARARGFLGALAREPAGLPAVGDCDDGYALSPLLRLSFAPPPQPPVEQTFPAAGCTLWRTAAAPGWRLWFDHGPLGMAPLFGHGHADALSVLLWHGDREIFTDAGTYTYTGDLRWRGYFRGTSAHNTVCVDARDQAERQTPFMWSAPFTARRLRSATDGGVLRTLASHDGYERLPGRVRHFRGLALHADGALTVWDWLDGGGEHAVELRWHAGVPVARADGLWRLGDAAFLGISGGETVAVRGAEAEPVAGWRSRRYGVREPITTLCTARRGPLPCEFVTRVAPQPSAVTAASAAADVEIFRSWI
jgi:hypothetical protein